MAKKSIPRCFAALFPCAVPIMKTSLRRCFAVPILCAVFWISAGTGFAQIRVISANPVEEAIHELAEQFASDTGNEVAVETMGSGAINRLFASDELADVIIGTTASIDQAVADGQAAGDKTNVARVGIGIVVRRGGPISDVSTVDALRQSAIDADGVIYNTAGSGQAVDRMFNGLGIGAVVTPKSSRPGSGDQTMARVMEGTGTELGFGLLSEIRPYEGNGIELIGRLPEELQNYTVYDGIVLARSESPDVSAEFIEFLTTAAAREAFAATGVD